MTRHRSVPMLHRIALVILFAGTASAHAAGLGSVRLQSALGQPFHASIPLASDDTNDLGSACVRARLELSDGTYILTPRISLTHNAQAGLIDLSTKQAINEPAVILYVEMGCSTSISRNYQLLLDPVNSGTPAHHQRTVIASSSTVPHQVRSEKRSETKVHASTSEEVSVHHTDRFTTKKSAKAKTAEFAQLPTFTKEMSLSSGNSHRTQHHASSLSNDGKWTSEDSITPVLKLSGSLADLNGANDAQRNDEFKTDQLRFAAIINGEDVTQNAEAEMKAAQQKMLLLQAENEQKKQQAQAEKFEQDEKRKVSFPITWFAALAGLVLICVAMIAWIAFKLVKAKKSQITHPWKNYHAASDTLIADLSTQTMLDSEFLTTVGSSYNTAVFSDTQFDPDPMVEEGELDDAVEEHGFDQSEFADSVIAYPDEPAAEKQSPEKPAAPKAPTPATSTSHVASETNTVTKPVAPQSDARPPVPPPLQQPKPAIKTARKDEQVTDLSGSPSKTQTAHASVTSAPNLNVKEIADIMQQAEFWMLLQDPFHAIEILEPYRDVAQPESPVPWIYLLDLYRMVGEKKKYEALIARIEQVFNAKIPRWDGQFGITPRTLNDFPHVVEKICALWETDEIGPYLESLLLDNRDGARQGFDLPVYRNIIQLITLARDPEKSKEHELRYGKAQAILFSQQVPNPEPTAPVATPATAANALPHHAEKAETAIKDFLPDSGSQTQNTSNTQTAEKTSTATTSASTTISDASNRASTINEPPLDKQPSQLGNNQDTAADSTEYDNASPMETKLELALAYQEIGEKDGARELLYEVIKEGSVEQSERAKAILKEIS